MSFKEIFQKAKAKYQEFREICRNKWVKLGFWSVLYLLWVIWLENFWFILGLGVIYDIHITKKVKWAFWKKTYKKGEKKNPVLDWIDAIIFAVIVVTFINTFFIQAFKIPTASMESSLMTGDHLFVNKLAYGPRLPMTPLTIPFTHNVIGDSESYSTLIQCDYKRLKGFGNVEVGDYVVFNFPHGDKVFKMCPAEDYYRKIRGLSADQVKNYERVFGPVITRPLDKKDHYVKRCVAVAGDTLKIVDGQIYVNSKAQYEWPGVQRPYDVVTKGPLSPAELLSLGFDPKSFRFNSADSTYAGLTLTAEKVNSLLENPKVDTLYRSIETYHPNMYLDIFPHSSDSLYRWTVDNYGPIWIPRKGATVELTEQNLPLYRRIITAYEYNTLEEKEGKIFINGKEAHSYTFRQDYYFMIGDNRHNSLDSRFWGFVPEDHIVGKPAVVWLSIDGNRKFPNNIRWRRFFKFV